MTLKRRLFVLLAACLSVLVFLSSPSLPVSVLASGAPLRERKGVRQADLTQARSEVPKQNAEKSGVNSFIIQMVNGAATCRAATVEEIPSTLPRPDDRGVPVRDLLNADLQNQVAIRTGENSSTGLTINLVALSQLQSDSKRATVIAAFERAAAVWTGRIKSPVTIRINIDYGVNHPDGSAFPSEVLGSTSSASLSIDYPTARDHLITSSSSSVEAGIYNSLPTSVVPSNTGDGSVVEVSRSLAQSLGFVPLNPDDTVATIAFNKNFTFDFNPDNGIDFDKVDFVSVAAHEIGHALGFISNAGGGSAVPVSVWDIFRFRPGTTPGTFTTAQRVMSIGGGSQVYFTGQTFVVEGSNTKELGLSTGGPSGSGGDGNQSSHWKAASITGRYIGIMDPTITSGLHEEITENDFSALETLGWNLVNSAAPPPPPPPPGNDNFANARVIVGCTGSVSGTDLNATKEIGEPNHSPDNNGGTHSVWYQWQSPSSGSVTFTTAGSGYDTVLGIYSGTSVNTLTLIGKNDDIPDVPGQPHQVTSSVTFPASAGTVYRIAVDGYNNGGSGGDMGPLKLNWIESNCTEPPPSLRIEEGTNRAVALDSVTFVLGPFPKFGPHNFSSDQRTRVMLFTSNLGLEPSDNLSGVLSVQVQGVSLLIERVDAVPGVADTSCITVKLDGAPLGTNLPLTVTLRGATSNTATVDIIP
ncbi:MAG TPA: NF038122 family metalloprotease [Pyrinomonadaceae bacterium]